MRHLEEHLDDGVIHALLDDELGGEELAAAQAHVLACEACSARVAEERLLAGEAERLISELDDVAHSATAEARDMGMPPAPDSPTVKGPPVVLIPHEEPSRWQRRRGPGRFTGIAAMIAVAAGAGYFAMQATSGSDTFAADSVVSDVPPPLPAPDARGFALTDSGAPAPPAEAATPTGVELAADPATTLPAAQESARDRAAEDRAASAEEDRAEARNLAAESAAPAAADPAPIRTRAREEVSAGAARAATPPAAPPAAAQRTEAAVERPEPEAAQESSAGAAGVSRSAPASLEQRAQVSMRIGLDEAQRLLGGPMHVIEGMQPEFVGLVPGRLVRGAIPSDYVVRVVYLDEQRRMIFLDQQRLDLAGRQMGMQRDTIPPEWVKGEVRLSISGQISAEAARALARRVR